MTDFIVVEDIRSGKAVAINIRYVKSITEETYGTVINLALQAPDCDERNTYTAQESFLEVQKQIENALKYKQL